MGQSENLLDTAAFLAALRDRTAQGVCTIALDHGELPVWVSLQDSPSVIFTFTGAANRNKPLPQFASTGLGKRVSASVIALADPSLDRHDEMRLAWYAGHEGFELQRMLPDLLRQIIDSLGATRVAFVGGSGGGFAALYYSSKIPDSVAIVLNPQTDLNQYHWGHRRRYREVCWPTLDRYADLNSVIDANLAPLYDEDSTNTAIFIQIASDYFHLTKQFAPFVAALRPGFRNRLIVRVANWGVEGHKPAPTSVWIPWLVAALTAPDTSATSIEETWNVQNPVPLPPPHASARSNGLGAVAAQAPGAADVELPIRRAASTVRPANRDEEIAAWIAHSATGALLGRLATPDDSA